MQNNHIIPFGYKDKIIRVVEGTDNTPYWVAKDIVSILGLENASEATNSLDEDEKANLKDVLKTKDEMALAKTQGLRYDAIIINESGLYSLIFKSQKQEAKQFKRWVTHEVLPSIRKTGGYGVSQNADLTKFYELMQQQFQMIALIQQQNEMILQLIKQQSEQINKIAHTQETYILIRQENRATTITAKQTDELVELIEKAAVPFAAYHRLPLQSAQRFLFGKLNERMAVKKYYHIKAVDFNKAMKYINELKNAAEASTNPTYKKILETDFDELGWGEEVEASEDRELYE